MISGNVLFERELIKQSSLLDLPMSHHDSKPCLSQRLNQRMSRVATTDFLTQSAQRDRYCTASECPLLGGGLFTAAFLYRKSTSVRSTRMISQHPNRHV